MNTDAPWPGLAEAQTRVLSIQTKLHRWSTDDPDRRFDDLFNLVTDPAFLVVAWHRVRGNRGARTAGIDGVEPRSIDGGEAQFLAELRDDLKARRFRPLPVRQRMIPKASGKLRSLGIPTARDRVVQASVKLVLEPIFERTSTRVRTGSVRSVGHRTPSRRYATSDDSRMNGFWRATSNRASTRFRIRL